MITTRTKISYSNGDEKVFLGVDCRVVDKVVIIIDTNGNEKVTTIIPLERIVQVQVYNKNDQKG